MRAARRWSRAAAVLLAVAGAALAEGQEPTPRPDTVPRPPGDTLRPRRPTRDSLIVPLPVPPDTIPLDSAERARILRASRPDTAADADTIRAPLGRPPMPPSLAVGTRHRWTREELFAAGAYTLADLLDRIPGVTTFRTGWITTPTVASFIGDARIRLFYDGIELDPLDDRLGGVPDLVDVQLWTLEELVIERAASEIRVHMTSWRVGTTNADTRTDIATGDEDTNLYRGFFGRRYAHGEALQLAAQQYSTESGRSTAGGDQLSLLARVGWAAAGFHADAFVLRTRRNRYLQESTLGDSAISDLDATRTDAYLRAGYGDVTEGPWLQLIAASQRFEGTSTDMEDEPRILDPDLLRGVAVRRLAAARSRAQYVGMAGYARSGIRLDLAARYRVFEGQRLLSPSARLSVDRGWIGAVLSAERRQADTTEAFRRRAPVSYRDTIRTTDVADAAVMLRPLSWVTLGGAAGLRRASGGRQDAEEGWFARAEGGIRLLDLWLGGGVLVRDSLRLPPPVAIDALLPAYADDKAVGTFAVVRGRLWKDIFADIQGISWKSDSSRYRPKYQARGEIFVKTEWRSRFPSGNFGLFASVREDYRARVRWPLADGSWVTADQSQIWSTKLEIRIVNAVIFWHYLNVFGERYDLVPGFQMPGQINLYGVRWQFWN